jgi:hypothetical protein
MIARVSKGRKPGRRAAPRLPRPTDSPRRPGRSYGPYDVTPQQIVGLGPSGLQAFVARLVRAEVGACGGDGTKVYTSGDVNIPDGGIDILVRDAPKGSTWVPAGTSLWHVTSSRPKALPAWIKGHLVGRPAVRAEHKRGARSVFAVGASLTAVVAERIEREHKIRLMDSERLAAFARRHPAEALRLQEHPVLPLIEEALGTVRGDYPFLWDSSRENARDRILDYVRNGGEPLRVEGRPGIGKSRLVLEALSGQPGEDIRVIYSPDSTFRADHPGFQLIRRIAADPAKTAILVFDECLGSEHPRWADQLLPAKERVRLITIGPAKDVSSAGTPDDIVTVEPLPEEKIRQFLSQNFQLPPELIDVLVRECGGFIKAAELLGRYLAKNPGDASAARLAELVGRGELFHRALGARSRHMEMLALFRDLGWYQEQRGEAGAVASHLGVSEAEFRREIDSARSEGIVQPRAGRLYVTPEVLANQLAVGAVRAQSDALVDLFFRALTRQARAAMLDRLDVLRDVPEVRRLLRALLARLRGQGGSGGGTNLDPETAEYLHKLSGAFGPEVLDALTAALGTMGREQLRELRAGRRDVVWALERLAADPGLFPGAAQLLLSLAEAENEPYGNSATGIWVGLFPLFLAGTQADNDARLEVLRGAMRSSSPTRRQLAVKAANAMLSIPGTHFVREGVDPQRPQDRRDAVRMHREAWRLVGEAFSDPDGSVRKEASAGVRRAFRQSLRIAAEAALEALEQVDPANEEARIAFRIAAADADHYDAEELQAEVLDRLRAALGRLQGTSFRDRLRQWAGAPTAREFVQDGPLGPPALKELAEQAVADPSQLEPELEWLLSENAERAGVFARALGEADAEERFLPWIEGLVAMGCGVVQSAAYLAGRAEAGGFREVENRLDEWAKRGGNWTIAAFEASWRAVPSEASVERMIGLVRDGLVPARNLGACVWGAWVARLGPTAVRRLIDVARETADPHACTTALKVVNQLRMVGGGADLDGMDDEVVDLLRHTIGSAWWEAMQEWSDLASRVLERSPGRVIQTILDAADADDGERAFAEILIEACKQDPRSLWPAVGARFITSYGLQLAFRDRLEALPADVLLSWAAENRPEGPRALARASTVKGLQLPALVHELLVRFGADPVVLDTLSARHLSGTWSGPHSAWLSERRAEAESWARSRDPMVARWAKRQVRNLSAELDQIAVEGRDAW